MARKDESASVQNPHVPIEIRQRIIVDYLQTILDESLHDSQTYLQSILHDLPQEPPESHPSMFEEALKKAQNDLPSLRGFVMWLSKVSYSFGQDALQPLQVMVQRLDKLATAVEAKSGRDIKDQARVEELAALQSPLMIPSGLMNHPIHSSTPVALLYLYQLVTGDLHRDYNQSVNQTLFWDLPGQEDIELVVIRKFQMAIGDVMARVRKQKVRL